MKDYVMFANEDVTGVHDDAERACRFVDECFIRSLCFDNPQSAEADKAILGYRHRRDLALLKAKAKRGKRKR